MRLRVSSLIFQTLNIYLFFVQTLLFVITLTSRASESWRTRHEEKEDSGCTGPALTDPLPWEARHCLEDICHSRLDLVPEVVQTFEEMDIGDVKCVAWRAADKDVAQMEEGEQSPGVLISPTGPEAQDALHTSDLRDSHE